MRSYFSFLVLGIFLISCNTGAPQKQISEYYNLDSLVNGQISVLTAGHFNTHKKVTLDGENEEVSSELTKEQWRDELKLFIDADMNVSSLSGVYECNCGINDKNSNLLVDRYSPKNVKDKSRIRLFEVYYFKEISQVRKILIEEKEENELYYSSRRLVMNFENNREGMMLSSWTIEGFQKLILKDTVSYFVEGTVVKEGLDF